MGAGLGSSAALCVATSAALTRLSDAISRGESGDAAAAAAPKGEGVGMCDGVENGCDRRPPPCELERINAWAFAGETVLHGTPSGLDNTVSCYGGAIRFVKGMDGAANATEVSEALRFEDFWCIFFCWGGASCWFCRPGRRV